ncbi:hypothetical protein F0562_019782 [Nyssa sinensis]|uniref:Uncharacterized protein n=1 Tax=Nyssa sinensis TaxID=561372 RepID=A0A5J5BUP8_9ASTE|nr:hypothetical protein F0562_019782 [Nyssa sinensis]
MGRSPCCAKEGLNKGAWTAQEDQILRDYIKLHGEGKWRDIPRRSGLKRCGKSCRLRWLNYLRPDIKRGNFSTDEEDLIIRLHNLLGNRWSLIAGRLPGRTDNEVKNYWNTRISKKKSMIKPAQPSDHHHEVRAPPESDDHDGKSGDIAASAADNNSLDSSMTHFNVQGQGVDYFDFTKLNDFDISTLGDVMELGDDHATTYNSWCSPIFDGPMLDDWITEYHVQASDFRFWASL